MRIAIRVPATNERGPQYMEQALAAIHQANYRRLPIHLEFAHDRDTVTLACSFPCELRAAVEQQLFAQYPDCNIERLPDEAIHPSHPDSRYWTAKLALRPDVFPIKRHPQFEDALNRVTADPVTAILTCLARSGGSRIEISIQPARERLRTRGGRILHRLTSAFFRSHHRLTHVYATMAMSRRFIVRVIAWLLGRCGRPIEPGRHGDSLTTSSTRLHDREDELQAAADKLGKLLFEASIRVIVTGPREAKADCRNKLREITGAFGQFSSPRLASFHLSGIRRYRTTPRRIRHGAFLLSTEELATLWHPPTLTARAPKMAIVESREMEPPVTLPLTSADPDLAIFGVTHFRSGRWKFGILPDDRRRHVAILGKTGMGKSTLLQNLVISDIQAGRGVGLIDPHGDLAETLLASVPKHRTNDVVLFDAGDRGSPLSFNLLACRNLEERPLVVSGIVSAFKKLYADSWGPRMEHILRNTLHALLEVPGTSLLSLLRMLSEAQFRDVILKRVTDPVVSAFWKREFAAMHPKLQVEAIAPIQNKVGHFVSSPLLRNIVGQSRSSLDLRRIMDDGKILIVNLSKGRIGEDASTLLGAFLVSSIQIAAMGRSNTPEFDRRDFYLYVDEFQNFATDSFATILSEARKYRLNLTIANQYLAQMEEPTADAVFGNVGTLLAFQVGAKDAEVLAEQLGGDLTPQDLMRLPRYAAYARLLIDGMPSRPFSMRTLPPKVPVRDPDRSEIIRRYSRERYAKPLSQVEAEIQQAFAIK